MRYGRKGGDGPTAGKKKNTYAAHAPDGALIKIGSFYCNTATAWVHMSQYAGVWHANLVRAERYEIQDAPRTVGHWAEAIRIK